MSSAIIKYTVEEASNFIQCRIASEIPSDVVEVVIEGVIEGHSDPITPFPPIDGVSTEVLRHIAQGNLIEAIKAVRNSPKNRGKDGDCLLGLKECKEYVESIRDTYFIPYADLLARMRR